MRPNEERIHAIIYSLSESEGIKLKSGSVEVAGQRIRYQTVSNTDVLLDKLISKGEADEDVIDERIPYWADLWPSALVLAQFIASDTQINSSTRVLELGCGLAIPGIAAGLKGAEVCLTDYLIEAIQVAELNWRLNLPEKVPDCRLMDWRKPDSSLKADCILASDVAYEERSFAPLIRAFRTLLRPGGRILLSEPNRPIAQPFLETLKNQAFKIRKKSLPINYQSRKISPAVYEIRFSDG